MPCHFALYAAASIGDKHSLALLVHPALQFLVHHALAKDKARRGLIIKILHAIFCFKVTICCGNDLGDGSIARPLPLNTMNTFSPYQEKHPYSAAKIQQSEEAMAT